jgi:type IV pilus assembly protein PilA
MKETLRRMREERATEDRGFTLIELLVVVVIIGILVGIAVPVYLSYRKGAENKSAKSDVRNAVTAIEQCYSQNGNAYPVSANNTGSAGSSITLTCSGGNMTINTSASVTVVYTNPGPGGAGTYTVTGTNASGGTTYTYDSNTGKITP